MGSVDDLRTGSIVWISHAPDPQGRNPKATPRPFVIISSAERIRIGKTIVGVGITSTFREPITDPMMFQMRWSASGAVETGFRRKCFAKANWIHVIPVREVAGKREFDGETEGAFVRTNELEKILLAMETLDDL